MKSSPPTHLRMKMKLWGIFYNTTENLTREANAVVRPNPCLIFSKYVIYLNRKLIVLTRKKPVFKLKGKFNHNWPQNQYKGAKIST